MGSITTLTVLFKKKTFSHRSRKFPNPYPTHTHRHRSTREIKLPLDLCFGVGRIDERILLQIIPHTPGRTTTTGLPPHSRASAVRNTLCQS
jgi:hypothetical protein